MFRDLYKQANDNIKGDRAILDRAFLKAAQPEKKKSPVLRYSFVGTAAAAVLVLGAVFVNSDIFMEKTTNMPTPDEINQLTATPTEIIYVEDKVNTINTVEETADNTSVVAEVDNTAVVTESKKATPYAQAGNETVGDKGATLYTTAAEEAVETDKPIEEEAENEAVMIMSIDDDEDDGIVTDAATGFTMRENAEDSDAEYAEETPTETAKETTWEKTTTSAGGSASSGGSGVKKADSADEKAEPAEEETEWTAFSYMQDLSIWNENESTTEGLVNTDVSPVTNKAEAINRADNELGKQYNEAMAWYDPIEKIWRVSFKLTGPDGGEVIVYLNSVGITQMIVYPGYYFGE